MSTTSTPLEADVAGSPNPPWAELAASTPGGAWLLRLLTPVGYRVVSHSSEDAPWPVVESRPLREEESWMVQPLADLVTELGGVP